MTPDKRDEKTKPIQDPRRLREEELEPPKEKANGDDSSQPWTEAELAELGIEHTGTD